MRSRRDISIEMVGLRLLMAAIVAIASRRGVRSRRVIVDAIRRVTQEGDDGAASCNEANIHVSHPTRPGLTHARAISCPPRRRSRRAPMRDDARVTRGGGTSLGRRRRAFRNLPRASPHPHAWVGTAPDAADRPRRAPSTPRTVHSSRRRHARIGARARPPRSRPRPATRASPKTPPRQRLRRTHGRRRCFPQPRRRLPRRRRGRLPRRGVHAVVRAHPVLRGDHVLPRLPWR